MSRRVSESRVLVIQGEAENEMDGGAWFAGRLFGMREGPTIEEVRDLCLDLRDERGANAPAVGPEVDIPARARALDHLTMDVLWQRLTGSETVVKAAMALVDGMPYTMGEPGNGEHNALRDAVTALRAKGANDERGAL